jgi:ketosteroid isomerase-like protein
MNKTTSIITTILIVILGASASAQDYVGKKKDIDHILQKIEAFSTHLVAGNQDGLTGLYSEDAKIFPSNKDILAGDSLVDYWQPSDRSKVTYHKITALEIKVVKDIAYDYGYYEGTSLLEEGSSVNWKGKYVIVWKKMGKEWFIYLDCWNRIENSN